MALYTGILGLTTELTKLIPLNCEESGGSKVNGTYINCVWEDVTPGYVRWTTEGFADTAGSAYPGPGTWGVNTSNYSVIGEAIVI